MLDFLHSFSPHFIDSIMKILQLMSSSISPQLYILLITLVTLAIPKSSKALNNLLLWFCYFFSFSFIHLCIIFSFSIMITCSFSFLHLSVIIFPLYIFTYLLYLGSVVFLFYLCIFYIDPFLFYLLTVFHIIIKCLSLLLD